MRMNKLVGWLVGGLVLGAVGFAVAGAGSIAILDGGSVSRTYAVTTDGSGFFMARNTLWDSVAGANGAAVTAANALKVDNSAVTQPVNVSQFNGVTPLMGNGVSGTGAQRVSISSDNTAVAGLGVAATAAAVPANAVYMGAQASQVLKGMTACDTHAFYDASDNGKKTVVAGVAAKKIYVCGFLMATGGTATNLSLTSGTGADCVTTSVAITPAYQLVANDKLGANSAFWNGLVTLANAENLCINASAGNAHQVEVWYTVQ